MIAAFHPHWAEEIFNGSMRYEFRAPHNGLSKLEPGSRVAMYGNGEGGGHLLGYFDVEHVLDVDEENFDQVWGQIHDGVGSGYDREGFADFMRSAGGRLRVLKVANPQRMLSEVVAKEHLKSKSLPGPRVLKGPEGDFFSTVMEANDAALIESGSGTYPWSEGTEPTSAQLHLALRSKIKNVRSSARTADAMAALSLPGYAETDLARLERELAGV